MTDIELINTAYKAPYQRGDILYVRETWCKGLERYIYRADYSDTEKFYRDGKEIEMKWHPSLHMPKDAARIFLRVTNVRVERLQDITVEDALAEGMDKYIRLNGELDENSIITSLLGFGTVPSRNPILIATDGMQIHGYGLSSLSDAKNREVRYKYEKLLL